MAMPWFPIFATDAIAGISALKIGIRPAKLATTAPIAMATISSYTQPKKLQKNVPESARKKTAPLCMFMNVVTATVGTCPNLPGGGFDMKQLVVNYHITEACNFGCRYCYAAWQKPNGKELFHNVQNAFELLKELSQLPKVLGNTAAPMRLNFAGGEPLLYPDKLQQLIEYAILLGMEPSIITNASLLTRERLMTMAPYLSVLGISLDSADDTSNRLIGRSDRKGRILDLDSLSSMLAEARHLYPQMTFKMNTVVNKHNCDEDFAALLDILKPDKWKVLRMLPVTTNDLAVTDQQYTNFVRRHQHYADIMFAEDNNDMRASYLMIDPDGRFFQNDTITPETDYNYSRPVMQDGVLAALADIHFDGAKFAARYQTQSEKEAV